MKDFRDNHAIFVRFTEHDGFSLSIIEALGAGMEVVWNHTAEKVLMAKTAEEAITQVACLIERIKERGMISSKENSDFINDHFEKKSVLNHFSRTLLQNIQV
jgi:hypothetical protein